MWWRVLRLHSIAAAKSLQSCPTLCNPIDGSPPGSPIPGILQARTLEWVAISFSNAWKWKVKVKSLSHVWRVVTPWTAAHQAPPSMGFSRQEYWSGVPLPSPLHSINWFQIGKGVDQGCIWEGDGTLLQYSCLENPMDGGVWRAAGVTKSDTTVQLHFYFSLSCIGGGNSNPLQCSCLENPRDRGAWWAAIYGV